MRLVLPVLLMLLAASCRREQRELRHSPQDSNVRAPLVRQSELEPGSKTTPAFVRNPAEEKAQDLADGKRLYESYNCVGCHAHGGGGIGPPLMDSHWIYGSEPENIHETIIQGRPNGMPSFGGKIPDYQVWQITAYVRSMAGLAPRPASSGRSDHLQVKVQEQSKAEEPPDDSLDKNRKDDTPVQEKKP